MLSRLFGKNDRPSRVGQSESEEYNYCPECGGEFRAEITQCAVCQVALISADEKRHAEGRVADGRENRSMHISSEDELSVVSSGTLADMKRLQFLLEKEVVGSLLVGEESGCKGGGCRGSMFELHVKAEDAAVAHQIIRDDFRKSTALDTHGFESESDMEVFSDEAEIVECPACGCRFIPRERTCPECSLCF